MAADRRWTTTFSRYSPGPVRLLGPIAVRVADWSRPRQGAAPMFDLDWLERVSVMHPVVPLALYAPAGLWSLRAGWTANHDLALTLGQYLLGLLTWSLVEYVAHRKAFHHDPASPRQLAFGYMMHGVHHAYPDDSRRWVMPISVTLPIALAVHWLFRVVAGSWAPGLFAGFVHGYLTYDLLHYFIHRGRMPTRLGRFLRQYHLAHHYSVPERHFGVSSPLWDVLFRTR